MANHCLCWHTDAVCSCPENHSSGSCICARSGNGSACSCGWAPPEA